MMIGSRVALAVILGASVAACATSPGPSQPMAAVPSGSPQVTSVPDVPSPSAAFQSYEPSATVAAPTAAPTPRPTPALPRQPTGVDMTMDGRDPEGAGFATEITTTITWNVPQTAETEIRVYGVNACFAKHDQDPCLVLGTPLPAGSLELIAEAPGRAGKVSWTWPAWDDIGGAVIGAPDGSTYDSLVVAAYNAAGHSTFTIVATAVWCPYCTY